jgi:hypothetical protein
MLNKDHTICRKKRFIEIKTAGINMGVQVPLE